MACTQSQHHPTGWLLAAKHTASVTSAVPAAAACSHVECGMASTRGYSTTTAMDQLQHRFYLRFASKHASELVLKPLVLAIPASIRMHNATHSRTVSKTLHTSSQLLVSCLHDACDTGGMPCLQAQIHTTCRHAEADGFRQSNSRQHVLPCRTSRLQSPHSSFTTNTSISILWPGILCCYQHTHVHCPLCAYGANGCAATHKKPISRPPTPMSPAGTSVVLPMCLCSSVMKLWQKRITSLSLLPLGSKSVPPCREGARAANTQPTALHHTASTHLMHVVLRAFHFLQH